MPKRRGGQDERLAEAVLGMRLRIAREAKGLSQTDVAAMIGFADNSQISRIEGGTRAAAWSEVVAIARALKLPLDELAAKPSDEERAEVASFQRTAERRRAGRAIRRGRG